MANKKTAFEKWIRKYLKTDYEKEAFEIFKEEMKEEGRKEFKYELDLHNKNLGIQNIYPSKKSTPNQERFPGIDLEPRNEEQREAEE